MSVNRVILLGRLGQDPEVIYSANGSAIAKFSIATSERWKDKQGQQQERTEWHRITAFGKLAEICSQYLKKGSQVYVEGSIQTNKYTDKQGIERYSTDIIINQMQMLDSKSDNSNQSNSFDQRNSFDKAQSFDDNFDVPF